MPFDGGIGVGAITASGPLGDYVVVTAFRELYNPLPAGKQQVIPGQATVYLSNPWNGLGWWKADEYTSPIRFATHQVYDDPNTWMPRDSFSFIADGLSNQLLVGEKFLPAGKKNVAALGALWDVSYIAGTNNNAYAIGRDIYNPDSVSIIARGKRDWAETAALPTTYPSNRTKPSFGGNHEGIANFLLGDGTVRSVSSEISTELLSAFGNVADGKSVALP